MAAMTTLCQLFDASETANGCSTAAEQAEKTKEAEDEPTDAKDTSGN